MFRIILLISILLSSQSILAFSEISWHDNWPIFKLSDQSHLDFTLHIEKNFSNANSVATTGGSIEGYNFNNYFTFLIKAKKFYKTLTLKKFLIQNHKGSQENCNLIENLQMVDYQEIIVEVSESGCSIKLIP